MTLNKRVFFHAMFFFNQIFTIIFNLKLVTSSQLPLPISTGLIDAFLGGENEDKYLFTSPQCWIRYFQDIIGFKDENTSLVEGSPALDVCASLSNDYLQFLTLKITKCHILTNGREFPDGCDDRRCIPNLTDPQFLIILKGTILVTQFYSQSQESFKQSLEKITLNHHIELEKCL